MNTLTRMIVAVVTGLGLLAGCTAPKSATSIPPYNAPTTVAAPAAAPAKTGPATKFDDGTWVIGTDGDIVPGTYRSTGAKEGLFEFCSVTAYSGDSADGSILSWDTANANEPMRVKLTGKAKSVKASGCETFNKV